MSWVKPYLRNVRRLNMKEAHQDHPEMISAFETSLIEIEVLFKHRKMGHKEGVGGVWPVILATFNYRTRPSMSYRQEYQQGPIHVGKSETFFRTYAWTDEEVAAYKKYRMEEDMELIGLVDGSVKAAMEALGGELEQYLAEAEEPWAKEELRKKAEAEKEKEHKNRVSMGEAFEPFIGIFSGIKEVATTLSPVNFSFKSKGKVAAPSEKLRKKAIDKAASVAYQTYKNYKKSHKLITW